MDFVTEQASSYEGAVEKIHLIYGKDYVIYSTKRITAKSFFGLRRRILYEVSAYRTQVRETIPKKSEVPVAKPSPEDAVQKKLLQEVQKVLELNEFSPSYSEQLIRRVQEESTPEELTHRELMETRILSLISDSIKVDRKGQSSTPHIFGLLGPTGVGKTTTIAKIAALHGIQYDSQRRTEHVAMVTIDSYRIGARAQIGTFGEIMGIPVVEIEHKEELVTYLNDHSDIDIILIDTIGKSPKDEEIQQEMKHILSACDLQHSVRFSLALSASMKSSDIKRTIRRFSEFPISSLTLTKLDETETVGNLISLFYEIELPILYVTTGQKVPQDILPMTEGVFLRRLQGFSVDLENLIIGDDIDHLAVSEE